MFDTLSDEELVVRSQKGDEMAFTLLMKRYTAKLLRYGNRLIPRENNIGDLVQDVFIMVYKNLQDFDAARRFSPWIYRIAHNIFIDAVRKNAKGPLYVFDFDKMIPHPTYEDPLPAEKENEQIRVLLEKHLEELSPIYLEIIDLYYFADFDYKEIADILHIPIGTVGIRLSRAKAELKKKFPKNDYE